MADDLSNKELAEETGRQQEKVVGVLNSISEKLAEQTESIEGQSQAVDLGERIKDLGGFLGTKGNEDTKQLKEAFKTINADLESAISSGDSEAEALARKQLEALEESVKNEEERREAAKALKEQKDIFKNMAEGIKNNGEKLSEFASNAVGTAGIIGGIALLALAIMSPEDFAKFISTAIQTVIDIFITIKKEFEGPNGIIEKAKGFLATVQSLNITIGGILLGAALIFSGPLILAFTNFATLLVLNAGKILGALKFMGSGLLFFAKGIAFISVQLFLTLGAVINGLITGLGAIITGLAAAIAPLLPAIIIAAGVAAIAFAIYKIIESFGGVMNTIEVAIGYLADGLAVLGNFFIFIGRLIGNVLGGVAGFFGFEVPPVLAKMAEAEYFELGRGATKAEEMKAKAKLDKQVRDAEKEREEETPVIPGVPNPMLQDTIVQQVNIDGTNLSNLTTETSDIEKELLGKPAVAAQPTNIIKGGDKIDNSSPVITVNHNTTTDSGLNAVLRVLAMTMF